jgi:hypothetical protein
MTTVVNLGHEIGLSIQFLDQNGNIMLTQPVPDTAPAWSNSTPATETLSVAANGLTATADPIAVGMDTISLSLAVGGKSFSATLSVEVDAAPQVLTSIAIVPVIA